MPVKSNHELVAMINAYWGSQVAKVGTDTDGNEVVMSRDRAWPMGTPPRIWWNRAVDIYRRPS